MKRDLRGLTSNPSSSAMPQTATWKRRRQRSSSSPPEKTRSSA
ncbi:MAG TPA: hypothetical protein VIL46_17985 [Gemmataceae bacterium]